MTLLDTRSHYGLVSRALHWVVVFGLIGQWALAEAEAVPLHQSIGVLLLAIALLRLAWRAFNPAPAWPADMKPLEIKVARIVHVAFYVLLFAIPISGWALGSAEDEPLRFFGAFDLPRIVVGSEDTLEEVHEMLFNLLVALAVLHVLGAGKHWLAARRSARLADR
jgi:cytochrome b561